MESGRRFGVRFLTILLFTLSLQVVECCLSLRCTGVVIPVDYYAQEEEIISVMIEVKKRERA